jgi:hypothetical protein
VLDVDVDVGVGVGRRRLNNPISWLLGGQDSDLLDVVQRRGDLGLDAFAR